MNFVSYKWLLICGVLAVLFWFAITSATFAIEGAIGVDFESLPPGLIAYVVVSQLLGPMAIGWFAAYLLVSDLQKREPRERSSAPS